MIVRLALAGAMACGLAASVAGAQPALRPQRPAIVTAAPGPAVGRPNAYPRSDRPAESDSAVQAGRRNYVARQAGVTANAQISALGRLTVRRPYISADAFLLLYSVRNLDTDSTPEGAAWVRQSIWANFRVPAGAMHLLDCVIYEQRVRVDSSNVTPTADYPTDGGHLYVVVPAQSETRMVYFQITPMEGDDLMEFRSCELSRIQ